MWVEDCGSLATAPFFNISLPEKPDLDLKSTILPSLLERNIFTLRNFDPFVLMATETIV